MIQKVVITINIGYLNKLVDVRLNLEAHGLRINELFEFGVITGQVEVDNIPILEQLPEVEEVKPDQGVQLPPPEASIQ